MYEERETFEPANLSILAMRSSERLRDVFTFIPPLYYSGRILANVSWSTAGSTHKKRTFFTRAKWMQPAGQPQANGSASRLHIVAALCSDDRGRDVCRIRNAFGGRKFARHGRGAGAFQHGSTPGLGRDARVGTSAQTSRACRRLPDRSGRSSNSGL